MIKKFRENKNLKYFILYCATFTFYGATFSSTGPLIPYLSNMHSVSELQFTYLFTCRSIGFLVGAFLMKALTQTSINLHKVVAASCLIGGLSLVAIPLTTSFFGFGVQFFLNSLANCGFEIVVNMCCLRVHRGFHEDYWLQLTHGMFGIGALVGPLFIRIFGMPGIALIGLGTVVTLPGYLYFRSPEKMQEQEMNDEENFLDQKIFSQEKKSLQMIKSWSYIILGALFFIYYGEEIGLAGWISSYAVLLGTDDKEGATKYPFIFWVSITTFRFILAGMKGKVTQKFIFLIKCQIICLLISLISVALSYYKFSIYWNSLTIGFCYSSMYAFLYTASLDYGQEIHPKQTAFLIMVGAIGEGSVSTLIGYVMKYVSIHAFFGSLLLFGVLKLILISILIKRFKEQQVPTNQLELSKLS